MKIVLQRSKKSSVTVDNKVVGSIDSGLVLLVSFTLTDTEKQVDELIDKVINLRVFDDENGVMNKSLIDVNGEILSISQFTLYGDTKKGRRPSYINAMPGDKAKPLYDLFNRKIKEKNIKIETGIFGAEMLVNIENDGPITLILESR